MLIRQSVETRSYSLHLTSHTTRNTIKSIPRTKENRKYRITMFRVRRARRRTRGRGACAWRRPWTRTRWPRCSRPATTTATSAAPPTPQLLLSRENGSCYTQRFGETFLSRLFLKFNILYWKQFFLNPKPTGPGKLDSNQMIVDSITAPN